MITAKHPSDPVVVHYLFGIYHDLHCILEKAGCHSVTLLVKLYRDSPVVIGSIDISPGAVFPVAYQIAPVGTSLFLLPEDQKIGFL